MPKERDLAELMVELRDHLWVLQDHARLAFQQHQETYVGEVAAKLRLLVCEGRGRHRPLLLDLLDRFQQSDKILVPYDGPPGLKWCAEDPNPMTDEPLRVRMHRELIGFRVDGKFVVLSAMQLIRLVAQKSGGAHEDWDEDRVLETLRRAQVFMFGQQQHAAALGAVTRDVIGIGYRFLAWYEEGTNAIQV